MSFLKCAIVGAPQSGKTSLINRFMSGTFEQTSSNVLTTYNVNMFYKIDSIKSDLKKFAYNANLSDTEENKNFNFKIFELQTDISDMDCFEENELKKIDVIILCYRIDSQESKDFLVNKAMNRINALWPYTPCVLVTCFSDLQDKFDQTFIEKLNPKCHYLCSSKLNTMVTEMFIDSFKIAVLNNLSESINDLGSIKEFNDWIVCESKRCPETKQIGTRISSRNNLNFKIVKTWKSSSRYFLSFLVFSCLCIYFVSIQYCIRNPNHCDEIYELSREALNESISALNESYLGFVQQINKI